MNQAVNPRQSQLAQIHEKVKRGVQLTDVEIVRGVTFYRKLADDLVQCGPAFKDAHDEAERLAQALEVIARARYI